MSGAGYEKQDTNVTKLVIIAVVSILFLVVSIIFVNELFLIEKEAVVQEMVLEVPSEDLKKIKEREQHELTTYQENDSIPGRYRIPIDRAMELVVQEANSSKSRSR